MFPYLTVSVFPYFELWNHWNFGTTGTRVVPAVPKFQRLKTLLMTGSSFKPMPDLYPIAERIIAIHRVAALFVPGDFRGIRSPIVFFPVEPLKNGRIQFRCDAKIDMWSLDRPRAALGDLIHSMQNHQLSRAWHSQRYLFITRHLFFFREAEGIPVPSLSLLQICHFDTHMTDAAQGNYLPLGFVA